MNDPNFIAIILTVPKETFYSKPKKYQTLVELLEKRSPPRLLSGGPVNVSTKVQSN